MEYASFIGIDPDSTGFLLALLKKGVDTPIIKNFSMTTPDLEKFVCWVKSLGKVCITIEGSNGQSKSLEDILLKNKIIFYSVSPSKVEHARKGFIGETKNNPNDAIATALLAMAQDSQGHLDRIRRVWFPDRELQALTRNHESLVKMQTSEINRFWKLLKSAGDDIYLLLKSEQNNSLSNKKILESTRILHLLEKQPDLGEWKKLNSEQLLFFMEARKSKANLELIDDIKATVCYLGNITDGFKMMIQDAARSLLALRERIKRIEQIVKKTTIDNKSGNALMAIKGIGVMSAAKIQAELIDIRRFINDDKLASYSGLCLKEHSTGSKKIFKKSVCFNHRLKNVLMIAAGNFVHFNPDHHLAGYYKNLLKDGMKFMEARKRVARALVRMLFKILTKVIDDEFENEQREDSVAIGYHPIEFNSISNTPSSPNTQFEKKTYKRQEQKRSNRKKILILY